jgi:hypothetical protein
MDRENNYRTMICAFNDAAILSEEMDREKKTVLAIRLPDDAVLDMDDRKKRKSFGTTIRTLQWKKLEWTEKSKKLKMPYG